MPIPKDFPLDAVQQGRVIAHLELACHALRQIEKVAWRVVPDKAPFDMSRELADLVFALEDAFRLLNRIDPPQRPTLDLRKWDDESWDNEEEP